MSLSVSAYGLQSPLYAALAPQAANAAGASSQQTASSTSSTEPTSAASTSYRDSSAVVISSQFAALLALLSPSGVFSALPSDPAPDPLSPAIADSSSAAPVASALSLSSNAPPPLSQDDATAQTYTLTDSSSSAASAASSGPISNSTTLSLDAVVAAYLSPDSSVDAPHASTHPNSGHAPHDHASPPANPNSHPGVSAA